MASAPVHVEEARLLTSASKLQEVPPTTGREIWLLGRSNVGKSSLVNYLLARHGLAHTSRTPGRTRLLNLFAVTVRVGGVNRGFTFVDLPGYGFGKMSRAEQQRIEQMLNSFLTDAPAPALAVLLVDARRSPQPADIEVFEGLRGRGIEPAVAMTKCDKLAKSHRSRALALIARSYGHAPVVLTSTSQKRGREELWKLILESVTEEDPS